MTNIFILKEFQLYSCKKIEFILGELIYMNCSVI